MCRCLFPETAHRPCCDQFHVGTIFFLCHHTDAGVCRLVDERARSSTAEDVNINGFLLSGAVAFTSLVSRPLVY